MIPSGYVPGGRQKGNPHRCHGNPGFNADSYGGFWSRTLYPSSPYDAWGFYFYSDHVDWVYGSRYYGFSVRAVRMPQN